VTGDGARAHWFEDLADHLGPAYLRYSFTKGTEQEAAFLVDTLALTPSSRVLDVGCGPGVLTAPLVERCGADRVAAVDPSPPFVAAARERFAGVDVREAAAEALPFDDDAFDVALAQLVVHFMRDPVAGIREMARVAKHGGVVAACVWDFGGDRGPLGPFWPAAREIRPDVDDESHRAGARQGHLVQLFTEAGLEDIREADLSVTRTYPSFEDWWTSFTGGVGPAGAFYASLDGAEKAALEASCRDRLPDGSFTLTAHAWAARGRAR